MCFVPQRRALFRHFFDIWTSKSGPRPSVFNTFDFEMCFAPQRRALFRHLNFQKWSEAGVFCTFWLGNVLRATTAYTFSTSQLQKVVREWCVLYMLISKCASRHNGVHFFISHLASWVRTRRFSEPTFRPSGATNHWKNTVNRDFPTFSRTCIFFLLIFSLLTLLTSAFQLSILSEVSLLNFLRWTALFRAAPGRWLIRGWFHCYGCLDCSMQAVQPEWLQSWWGCDGDLWHSWWWLRPSQWTPPVSSWSWQHLSPLHLARSPSEHHMLMGAARADKLADHHHELVDVLTLKPTILIKPYKTNLVI